MTRSRPVAFAIAIAGLAAVAVAVGAGANPDNGPINPCVGFDPDDLPHWCLEWGGGPGPDPGSGGDGEGAGDGDGGGSGDGEGEGESGCQWTRFTAPNPGFDPAGAVNGPPPDDQDLFGDLIWFEWCGNLRGQTDPATGPFMWMLPEDADELTVEDLAGELYDRLEGRVPDPVVVTSPPAGVDAIVSVPVFVEVTNWVDELVESDRLGGATVTVTATPELRFDPGEEGAGMVSCAGSGRSFDPAGGDLWEQAAAAEACTYAYGQRTGVDGRPEEWASVVTVRWSISWSATSGESGSFPTVERSVPIARGIGEVQAVVTGDG